MVALGPCPEKGRTTCPASGSSPADLRGGSVGRSQVCQNWHTAAPAMTQRPPIRTFDVASKSFQINTIKGFDGLASIALLRCAWRMRRPPTRSL